MVDIPWNQTKHNQLVCSKFRRRSRFTFECKVYMYMNLYTSTLSVNHLGTCVMTISVKHVVKSVKAKRTNDNWKATLSLRLGTHAKRSVRISCLPVSHRCFWIQPKEVSDSGLGQNPVMLRSEHDLNLVYLFIPSVHWFTL